MKSLEIRLTALENAPKSRIPHFIIETMDGTTQTAHGYQLLAIPDIQRVHYDPTQLCAQVVIDLFRALHPEAEAVADAQH